VREEREERVGEEREERVGEERGERREWERRVGEERVGEESAACKKGSAMLSAACSLQHASLTSK
jgi:hypothetical protein